MKNEYKTKPRNAILEYLKENADRRFTAKDIVNAMSNKNIDINRSTIYRNIDRLVQDGQLIRFKENDTNSTCFQYSEEHGSCREHMHGQCIECGKIFHLDNSVVSEFDKRLKKEYGLQIDYENTIINGICKSCQKTDY